MSPKVNSAIAVIGIDVGKNSFHVVAPDKRGAIMLRQKWSRGQAEARLANLPPCPAKAARRSVQSERGLNAPSPYRINLGNARLKYKQDHD
jgi:hypothetical protein